MRLLRLATLLPLLVAPAALGAQQISDAPAVVLEGVPFTITLEGVGDVSLPYEITTADARLLASGDVPAGGTTTVEGLVLTSRGELPLAVQVGGEALETNPTLTPGWFSLLPPVIAIIMALIFREVVTALFAGVWLGALAVAGFNPLAALWRVIDEFAVPTLADTDAGHTQIVVFSLLLGGMVGVIARNGGTMGIVEAVSPFARSRRRGKIATWLAGMAIFFDDYANTLLVGNTMRSITDRLKISREKLAYLVDSTAAPLAAIVPLSTWVGYEIGLIADGLRIAAEQNPALAEGLLAANPLTVFIETIPYRFYPLLALYFAALTSFSKRDFGPMAAAEERAASGGGLYRPGAQLTMDTASKVMEPKEDTPHRWWNAAIPVVTVILVVVVGLYTTGRAAAGPGAALRDMFGAADPFQTLLWGSLAGCVVAMAMSAAQGLLSLSEGVEALVGGMRAMMTAMILLVLAWSLGLVTEELGTAQYLTQLLDDRVALQFIPVIVFTTAAAMSFATGTSWGTMAILLPLVIPLTVSLGGYSAGFSDSADYTLLLGAISSVLAGSIFGDHCSPISDTTVLSSMASGCDHMDHVRTQLPYAMVVAIVGMLLGDIGTAFGLPIWVALGGGMLLLYGFLRYTGRRIDDQVPASR